MLSRGTERKSNRNTIFASVVIASLFICVNLIGVKGAINESMSVEPGSFVMVDFSVTKGQDQAIVIEANSTINVLLMNQTNAGLYIANRTYNSTISWLNITERTYLPDVDVIANTKNHSYSTNANNSVHVYLIIENNGTAPVKVIVLFNPTSLFLDTLKHTTKFAVLAAMIYLTFYLFSGWRRERKNEHKEKAKIFKGFGLTFMFASINYFFDTFQWWYGRETYQSFYPEFKVRGDLLPFAVLRIDQIIFLTLLLFSDLFMIYQIEKIVGRKKYPIMTILIGTSIVFNVMIFLVPGIFDVAFAILVLTLIITVIQIIWIYASIMHGVPSKLRLRSIAILAGILLPIAMALIGSELYPPNSTISMIIANSLSFASVFFIKYGLD